MGETEVGGFLSHLATQRNVAESTQNQALNALVFLYKVVLERPLESIGGVVRAKKPVRLPFVLSEAMTVAVRRTGAETGQAPNGWFRGVGPRRPSPAR